LRKLEVTPPYSLGEGWTVDERDIRGWIGWSRGWGSGGGVDGEKNVEKQGRFVTTDAPETIN
jgi:hypothetical protein